MGLNNNPNANALLGAMNAMFYVGGFFGSFFNQWVADRFGRRISLATGCTVTLISAALTAGSVDIGMFIAFRFLTGFG
jgi:MFS family permease